MREIVKRETIGTSIGWGLRVEGSGPLRVPRSSQCRLCVLDTRSGKMVSALGSALYSLESAAADATGRLPSALVIVLASASTTCRAGAQQCTI